MSVVQLRAVFIEASVCSRRVSFCGFFRRVHNCASRTGGQVRKRTHRPRCQAFACTSEKDSLVGRRTTFRACCRMSSAKHWRLQLGTSRRNTTPRICSCQLQHRIQQRPLSRFLHHWVPRQFLPRSSQEYGRVELRCTSPHGTRLVYSLSRCSWGPSRHWPPQDWMLHEATSSRLLTVHSCWSSASCSATEPTDLMVVSIPWRCAVQVIRPWVGSAKVNPQS